jgi:hypothetical protein
MALKGFVANVGSRGPWPEVASVSYVRIAAADAANFPVPVVNVPDPLQLFWSGVCFSSGPKSRAS